jgi:hypothetical protein
VLDGRITNSLAVGGILAVDRYVRTGTRPQQPADAPWPQADRPNS